MTLFEKMLKKSKVHIIAFVVAIVLLIISSSLDLLPANYTELIGLGIVLIFFFVLFINLVAVSKRKPNIDSKQTQKVHHHKAHHKQHSHKK